MISEKTIKNFKKVMDATDNDMGMFFYAWLFDEYDKVDKNTQEYKSFAGQKDLFMETERFFLHLTDEDFLEFEKKYKKRYFLINSNILGSKFVELDIIIDLIHLHKMIRFFNAYFELSCFCDISSSYLINRTRAKELQIADEKVARYCREIMAK